MDYQLWLYFQITYWYLFIIRSIITITYCIFGWVFTLYLAIYGEDKLYNFLSLEETFVTKVDHKE